MPGEQRTRFGPEPSAWLRRKPVAEMSAETGADTPEGGELRRSIGLFQLTSFGVGATVGTGIFFVLSEAMPKAGPAVVVSFLIAAVTAGLSALCYAELASAVPVSGSSYSYAYATLGESVAMGVGGLPDAGVPRLSAAVAVGWCGVPQPAPRTTCRLADPDRAVRGALGADRHRQPPGAGPRRRCARSC